MRKHFRASSPVRIASMPCPNSNSSHWKACNRSDWTKMPILSLIPAQIEKYFIWRPTSSLLSSRLCHLYWASSLWIRQITSLPRSSKCAKSKCMLSLSSAYSLSRKRWTPKIWMANLSTQLPKRHSTLNCKRNVLFCELSWMRASTIICGCRKSTARRAWQSKAKRAICWKKLSWRKLNMTGWLSSKKFKSKSRSLKSARLAPTKGRSRSIKYDCLYTYTITS